jgi:2-phospho-L-lactate guanylyltransferase
MKARALVPLKDLVEAKSRLSGLLRPAERRALAQAMAEDVLSTLTQHPGFEQVILLSDDPGADMLAQKYGADHWPESALECRGLNNVIARSCDLLFRQSESPVVVLHADLPCLDSADLTAVLHALYLHDGLVLACDRLAAGTNLLAFTANSRPEFLFGVNSCTKHCASAVELGIRHHVVFRAGTSLDVDTPEDIKLFIAQVDQGATGFSAHLLQQPNIGTRIRAQLDSMAIVDVTAEQLMAKVKRLNG